MNYYQEGKSGSVCVCVCASRLIKYEYFQVSEKLTDYSREFRVARHGSFPITHTQSPNLRYGPSPRGVVCGSRKK